MITALQSYFFSLGQPSKNRKKINFFTKIQVCSLLLTIEEKYSLKLGTFQTLRLLPGGNGEGAPRSGSPSVIWIKVDVSLFGCQGAGVGELAQVYGHGVSAGTGSHEVGTVVDQVGDFST